MSAMGLHSWRVVLVGGTFLPSLQACPYWLFNISGFCGEEHSGRSLQWQLSVK